MRAFARYALIACALTVVACHSKKKISQAIRDLPVRGPEKLLERVLPNTVLNIRYFSAKANVDMKDSADSHSFKAHIRCVTDSAAWISVVPLLGIEVARAMLTKDSLKMMDKLGDHYWTGDTAQAKKKFGLQPNLTFFQQALLGLPIGLDPKEKYKSEREEGEYTLTSKEKRRFRRAAEDLTPDDTLPYDKDMSERRLERTLRKAERKDAIVYKYWIEPDSFRVTRVTITDLAHDQQADVRYLERTNVDGRSLPTRLSLSLSDPKRKFSGALELEHISLDGPLQLNFRIPEKFTRMP